MSPPSAAAVALKGLFSQPYDRYKLTTNMVTLLVDFFDGRGESIADLSLACEAADWASFEAEWKAYARDANISSEGDQVRLVGWLRARMSAPGTAANSAESGWDSRRGGERFGVVGAAPRRLTVHPDV